MVMAIKAGGIKTDPSMAINQSYTSNVPSQAIYSVPHSQNTISHVSMGKYLKSYVDSTTKYAMMNDIVTCGVANADVSSSQVGTLGRRLS